MFSFSLCLQNHNKTRKPLSFCMPMIVWYRFIQTIIRKKKNIITFNVFSSTQHMRLENLFFKACLITDVIRPFIFHISFSGTMLNLIAIDMT